MKRIRHFMRSSTARLALTYIAIIMTMTILFSIVLFMTSARQLDRPPKFEHNALDARMPPATHEAFESLLNRRAEQGKAELLSALIALNLIVLIVGSGLSYLLARRALEPIERAMDDQTRFISDASHELRTPLSVLQTTNEVALRKPHLTLTDAKQTIEHNIVEVLKLRALSDSLLELLSPHAGNATQANIPLHNIVSEAMTTIIPAAQAKHITVEDTTPNITVFADATSATQVVRIFLDNAVKYAPERSTIHISADTTKQYILLHVQDEGPGIAESEQDAIFRRFYRTDQSRTKQTETGYGLGLAIAKAICDKQGMTINVDSTPGEGSIFTLRMNTQR